MADGPYAEKGTHGDLAPGGEPVALWALIEHGVRLEWHEAAVQPLPPDSPPSSPPPAAPQNVVDLSAPPDALDLFLLEEKVVTVHGRSFPVFPIVAALAVALVATLILAWSFSGRSRSSPGPTQTAQAQAQETASGATTPTSLMAEDVELDATDGSAALGSAARRSGPASAPASGFAVRGALLAEARAFGIAGAAPALPSRLRAGSAPAAPSRRQPAVDERLPVPTGKPPDAIYSSADQDVEPPVLVRPKVSIGPRTGSEPEGMTVLDLLISETGQVEAITLAAPTQDHREAMIFSAVKTWTFRPGMRDGHSVRYQRRIWIRISPIGTIVQ